MEDSFSPAAPRMSSPGAPTTRSGVAAVYFRHRATRVILACLLPLLAARLALGGWFRADAVVAAVALLAWPAFEWLLHVGIHIGPFRIAGRTIDPRISSEHRRHHADPGVVDHLLFPPATLAVFSLLSVVLGLGLLGPRLGVSAAVCFHLGGLMNGWVHLLTHSPVAPGSAYARWARQTHLRHHYQSPDRLFGITAPYVDWILEAISRPAKQGGRPGRARDGG